MRIAQLTRLGYNNYGQVLQKFALNHTLKKFSDFVEVLWFSSNSLFSEVGSASRYPQIIKHEGRLDWQQKFFRFESVRQSKFKDFENLNIPTRFNFPYPEDIADEYDFFVVGSDQVWNPGSLPPNIFLNFVPREKKITYAASFGVNAIPDEKKELFRRGISDFNFISVREENAIEIIKNLTGRSSLLVLDPVLLLTADEWLTVAQKPTWFKGRYSRGYVLTYHLSKLPPLQCRELAEKLDLPVINLLDTENFNHFTIGPAEFVWLFANASFVFTNSFHGMAFSTLFKHPFVLNGLRSKNDQRLLSFLKLFGLGNRFNPADPMNIDFTHRNEILPVERARAFKFLSEAFGINPLEKLLGGDA